MSSSRYRECFVKFHAALQTHTLHPSSRTQHADRKRFLRSFLLHWNSTNCFENCRSKFNGASNFFFFFFFSFYVEIHKRDEYVPLSRLFEYFHIFVHLQWNFTFLVPFADTTSRSSAELSVCFPYEYLAQERKFYTLSSATSYRNLSHESFWSI